MKMNRNQALYKALPGSWITYSVGDNKKNDYKYVCEVKKWNTTPVIGINEKMIRKDIKRKIESFTGAGGLSNLKTDDSSLESLKFVTAVMNEDIPDITCKINPETYYCKNCGQVTTMHGNVINKCPHCHGSKINLKQLQMVYACECGFATGVTPPKGEIYFDAKDSGRQYKWRNSSNKTIEMTIKCPNCNNILYPDTATSLKLFYPQSGNLVNLYNKKYSDLIDAYSTDAELLILAKWFNILTKKQFDDILDTPKQFFEFDETLKDNPLYKMLLDAGLSHSQIIQNLNKGDVPNIATIKSKIENIIPLFTLKDRLDLINTDLIEFDTLKYPKKTITLEEAINRGKNLGKIFDEMSLRDLIVNLKIKDMQISESVQIVNYAYGFTRKRNCPGDQKDAKHPIRLCGFDYGNVYTNILDTEGLLIEFNMLEIFKWLKENMPEITDIVSNELEAKKWFIEHVNLDSITHYQTIDGTGNNRVTKVVYSLLHTISHMMIKSAGNLCGIGRDSLSEIILPNTCSIFIYPTSNEGVVLGSLSGMFITQLEDFLDSSLNDNRICTFDPVCSESQNGACIACTYLSEVTCSHFNKDLSRSYLYGGTIKINNEEIKIKKGFWL